MEREDEIRELLKYLLKENLSILKRGMGRNNLSDIKNTCNNLLKNSNFIEGYVQELEEIEGTAINKV